MLRSLLWAAWQFLYMGLRAPLLWRIRWLQRHGRQDEAWRMLEKQVPLWTRRLFRHIGVTVQVEGRENLPPPGETVLFVSNHQSYVDIPVFLYDLGGPHALMAKRELGKIPFLGGWIRALGSVLVERDDIRAAAAAIKESENVLKSGNSLIICPEGTRSKSDDIAEFKGGSVRIAFRAGVPIVPIAIDGTYKILEGNRYRVQKGTVRMVILPKVETAGLSKEEQKALPEQLRQMIKAAKDNRGGQES